MAKRRTKKQKQSAKHSFQISWEPSKKLPQTSRSEADVKGQKGINKVNLGTKSGKAKNAVNMEEVSDLASIKKDISKSLFLTAIILASEMVIYFYLR